MQNKWTNKTKPKLTYRYKEETGDSQRGRSGEMDEINKGH